MSLNYGKIVIVTVKKTFICGSYDKGEIKEKKVADDIRKFPSFLSHVQSWW